MYYFIYVLLSGLAFSISALGFIANRIKPSVKLLIFFYSCLITYLFAFSRGQIGTLLLLLGTEVFIFLCTHGTISCCFLSTLGYISAVALNYLLLLLFQTLFHLPVTTSDTYSLVFSCFFVITLYFLFRFIQYLIEKHQVYESIVNYSFLPVMTLNLIICAFIIVLNISIAEKMSYTDKLLVSNAFLFLLFFLFSTFLLYAQYKEQKRTEAVKIQLAEYKILKENIHNLEEFSEQMRAFKHDYMNILFSIDCFLQENDLQGFRSYYEDNILPFNDRIKLLQSNTQDLNNLLQTEIKSIFLVKVQTAFSSQISVTVRISGPIEQFWINAIDLVRILGIFMDNSIEAASAAPNPKLDIFISSTEMQQKICISNSCIDRSFDKSRLFEKGYSTKQNHHGIGLYNVGKILKQYPSCLLMTNSKDSVFTQTLIINKNQ